MNRAVLMAAVAIAVLVLSAAGYWTRGVAEKHVEDREMVELLRNTTGQLRLALAPRAPAELVARLDQNLQAAKAPRDPQLAEAAELYIISAREIARRRVEAERLERQAAANRAALEAYMARGTRRRNEGWFQGALELKKNVERDHYELNRTLKALDDLLDTLPEAEKKLAPHVAQPVLLEDAERDAARRQAQAELKRADAQLQRARNLAFR
jgi:hypothetical protein